jgi:hypothetical protein
MTRSNQLGYDGDIKGVMVTDVDPGNFGRHPPPRRNTLARKMNSTALSVGVGRCTSKSAGRTADQVG